MPSFALSANQAAPPIALRDSSGTYFYLSDYIGPSAKKPAKGVIVNFFASTCDPCRKELPALNSLVDEFAQKNIKVVIIGYKEGFDAFMGMLERYIKVEKPVICRVTRMERPERNAVLRPAYDGIHRSRRQSERDRSQRRTDRKSAERKGGKILQMRCFGWTGNFRHL